MEFKMSLPMKEQHNNTFSKERERERERERENERARAKYAPLERTKDTL